MADNSVMMSSLNPSLKYCCSGSVRQICKRQHGNGRFENGFGIVLRFHRAAGHDDAKNLNGLGDVLQRAFAHIFIGQVGLVADLIEQLAGNADATGVRQRFDPGGQVHTVTHDVVSVDDDVSEIDTDAIANPELLGPFGFAAVDGGLQLDRTHNGIDGAGELSQQTIAQKLDHPAVECLDLGFDDIRAVLPVARNGSCLVDFDEPAETDHIEGKNCGQSTLNPVLYHVVFHSLAIPTPQTLQQAWGTCHSAAPNASRLPVYALFLLSFSHLLILTLRFVPGHLKKPTPGVVCHLARQKKS